MKFLSVLVLLMSVAQARDFEVKGKKFSLEVPSNWEEAKDLYGIPLTLLGPMMGDTRPAISITPTPLTSVRFKDQKNEDYIEARKKWLKKHEGKFLRARDYQKTQWPGVTEAHVFGYEYEINKITFYEESHYVLCGKELYHNKVLLRSTHADQKKAALDILRGFKCI